MHILSCDQMVLRKINNQTTRCANSIFYTTLFTNSALNCALKRLNSLTLACHALLECKTLTLTELGRNLPTKARTKHNIKRIDRLLGNRHLHKERLAVYRWHASFICSGNSMPIVLVDWSDIREQKRLMVLRASGGTTWSFYYFLWESVSAFRAMFKGGSWPILADLASILPSNTTPLIVSDAGFKVPWYKSVEKLGWYWLSRVRGKVQYADLGAENWQPISNLHGTSSSRTKTLGYKRLTKSNPISCQIALYKSRPKGRKISVRHGPIVIIHHLKSTPLRQKNHGF